MPKKYFKGTGFYINPEMQVARNIATYMRARYPKSFYRFDMMGNFLTAGQANLNKAIQMYDKKYPDFFCLEHMHGHFGLFIEIKKEGFILCKKNGMWVSDHVAGQAKFIDELNTKNYYATFGTGFDECKKIIDWYMKPNDPLSINPDKKPFESGFAANV